MISCELKYHHHVPLFLKPLFLCLLIICSKVTVCLDSEMLGVSALLVELDVEVIFRS